MSEWISVRDKLPKPNEKVLTVVGFKEPKIRWVDDEYAWNDEREPEPCSNKKPPKTLIPTHWVSIPENPKLSEGEFITLSMELFVYATEMRNYYKSISGLPTAPIRGLK